MQARSGNSTDLISCGRHGADDCQLPPKAPPLVSLRIHASMNIQRCFNCDANFIGTIKRICTMCQARLATCDPSSPAAPLLTQAEPPHVSDVLQPFPSKAQPAILKN